MTTTSLPKELRARFVSASTTYCDAHSALEAATKQTQVDMAPAICELLKGVPAWEFKERRFDQVPAKRAEKINAARMTLLAAFASDDKAMRMAFLEKLDRQTDENGHVEFTAKDVDSYLRLCGTLSKKTGKRSIKYTGRLHTFNQRLTAVMQECGYWERAAKAKPELNAKDFAKKAVKLGEGVTPELVAESLPFIAEEQAESMNVEAVRTALSKVDGLVSDSYSSQNKDVNWLLENISLKDLIVAGTMAFDLAGEADRAAAEQAIEESTATTPELAVA